MMDTHTEIPLDLLVELRHTIHQHPELSGEEKETRKRVIEFLKPTHPDQLITVGEKSLAAVFGNSEAQTTVMVRCELDALPITEVGELPYKSVNTGVAHSCGHDGHLTILAGLATVLKQKRPEDTRVILLFQHAEEIGEGAMAVVQDPVFQDLHPDYVVALHNVPGYPLRQVVVKKDSFTPSVVSIAITLNGKTAHAAEPEMGINPAMAVARIVQAADELQVNEQTERMQLLTPVQIELGEEAYGTSAGNACVKYTLRAWTDAGLKQLKEAFTTRIAQICMEEQLGHTIQWVQPFSANQNDAGLVDVVRSAAGELGLEVHEKEMPFKWGEDFGLFTQRYTGVLFGLGSGEDTPALHNPDYNFPDELIETGVQLFFTIIQQLRSH